jgi:hypothetical protein
MGDTSTPAIRNARKMSASIKAAQTITVDEVRRPPAETEMAFAGTGAAGTIRMMRRYRGSDEKKAPGQPGPGVQSQPTLISASC